MGTAIAEANVRAVLLIGQEAPRIAAVVQQAGAGEIVHCCRDLAQALSTARHLAQTGDVVLLSPACASFDQFSSYAERGDLFKRLVRASALYEPPDLFYFRLSVLPHLIHQETKMSIAMTREQERDFAEQGFIVLEHFLTSEELASLRAPPMKWSHAFKRNRAWRRKRISKCATLWRSTMPFSI